MIGSAGWDGNKKSEEGKGEEHRNEGTVHMQLGYGEERGYRKEGKAMQDARESRQARMRRESCTRAQRGGKRLCVRQGRRTESENNESHVNGEEG